MGNIHEGGSSVMQDGEEPSLGAKAGEGEHICAAVWVVHQVYAAVVHDKIIQGSDGVLLQGCRVVEAWERLCW